MPRGFSSVPKYQKSKIVIKTGSTISSVYVTITFTGTIKFYITAVPNPSEDDWEEVTVVSATRKEHNFSTTGTEVRWYAVLSRRAHITELKISEA